MAALCNRGHYIFALWFLSSSFFFFFSPRLISAAADCMSTILRHVVWPYCEFGLKCAARGSLEIQDAKNRHFGTIAQLRQVISSELRHISKIGEKNLLTAIPPAHVII